jgi:hypothetical protein
VSEWVSHPHSIRDRNGGRTYFAVQTCWISFKKCAVASYILRELGLRFKHNNGKKYIHTCERKGKGSESNRSCRVDVIWKKKSHTQKKDVAVTKFALKQHVYVYCTTRPTDANTSKRHNKHKQAAQQRARGVRKPNPKKETKTKTKTKQTTLLYSTLNNPANSKKNTLRYLTTQIYRPLWYLSFALYTSLLEVTKRVESLTDKGSKIILI